MPFWKFCIHCERVVCNPCREDGSPDNGLIVYAAADWELRRIFYFRKLARSYARRCVSRRKTPDWLNAKIMDFEGRIYGPDDHPFCTPDCLVDDVFPSVDSTRWLSDFRRFAYRRPRQRPHRSKLPALCLIDLALKIEALTGGAPSSQSRI